MVGRYAGCYEYREGARQRLSDRRLPRYGQGRAGHDGWHAWLDLRLQSIGRGGLQISRFHRHGMHLFRPQGRTIRRPSRGVGQLRIHVKGAAEFSTCTAFLISQEYLLTAAHCLTGVESDDSARLMQSENRPLADIEELTIHFAYLDTETASLLREVALDEVAPEHDEGRVSTQLARVG